MYTSTLATVLFGAVVLATDMMSGSGSSTTMNSTSMTTTISRMMGANNQKNDANGMMYTVTTSTSTMMYGGSSMMSSTTSMTTSTTSATGAVSTQQNNAASCANQLNTGMSGQIVTIVQVSDLNGTTLRYSPENIVAPVGSIVQFQFHPKNHTVTESSFAAPCQPLAKNLTSTVRPGQKSGFVPVTTMDTDMKVYNMLINDTKPIWIYCGQVGHCQKGMVMVVNQNATDTVKTLENYQAAAMALPIPGASSSASSSAVAGTGASASAAVFESASSSTTTAATPATSTIVASSASGARQASGSSNGIPAVFTGAAVPRSVPFQYAAMAGLAMAGVGALL